MSKTTNITDKTIQSYIREAKKLTEKYKSFCIGNNLWFRVNCSTGSAHWYYRIAIKDASKKSGYRFSQITIGEYPAVTLMNARIEALKLRDTVKSGISPLDTRKQEQNEQLTLAEIFEQWASRVQSTVTPRYLKLTRAMFYNHTSKISNLPLASLTAKMVTEQSLNPMIEAGHTSQARLLLVCLKRLSNFAYEHDITEHNQLAKLRNDFYKVIPRAIVLSNQELISFMKALNDEAISEAKRAFLYLTLLLGTRKMELVNLTWHNYDQSAKTIKLVETKNKTDLLISLPSQALAILDKMPRINEFVFPSGKNIRMDKPIGKSTPNAWLREVVEIAKIGENLTVHDLRRTFVTTLAELGFPFELIDTAVNHKLSGVRAHYFTSKDLERRRDMLQKWANHLDALLGCQ